MGNGKTYVLTFEKKEKVSKDAYTFYFQRGNFPDFIPGQYLRLELPHKADDRGTTRYFTISSSPLNKKYVTITTKINRHSGLPARRIGGSRISCRSSFRDSGVVTLPRMTEFRSTFKHTLFNLKPGTKVNAFGPMGWFLLPKHEEMEKVFIAGGIGVTPFHSLLTTLAKNKLEMPMTLISMFLSKEHAVFYDELMEVAKNNSQIKIIYLFSEISKSTITKHVSNLKNVVYYIVGSEAMVTTTKKLLLDLKIAEEKIQTEDFTGY